ncbi:unnamed protein product, partial [Didymodactylos carnosus]
VANNHLVDFTSSPVAIPSQTHVTPDVETTRFDSRTSKAFARSQLAKRFSSANTQPYQRHIPVQSLSNTNIVSVNNPTSQDQSSLAATVAASVAVSVTQPFLKLHSEFEQKVKSVLDKIQDGTTVVHPTLVQHEKPIVDRFQQQMNDCIDTRMKYMEKVQEQQQIVLKELVQVIDQKKYQQQTNTKSPKQQYSPDYNTKLSLSTSRKQEDNQQLTNHTAAVDQLGFLNTLINPSPPTSPPVRLHSLKTTSHKTHRSSKKVHQSQPSAANNTKRLRVGRPSTGQTQRHRKSPSPPLLKTKFNVHRSLSPPSNLYPCSVCDRSKSRSPSPSDASHPRPYIPLPFQDHSPPERPHTSQTMHSDGFIPHDTRPIYSAIDETYLPFDKYLNNKDAPTLHEQRKVQDDDKSSNLRLMLTELEEAKLRIDENYSTLERRKNDPLYLTHLELESKDKARIYRLVDRCVKTVTKQVQEEVSHNLELEEIAFREQTEKERELQQMNKKQTKKIFSSRTQLAFDRHLTLRGQQNVSPRDTGGVKVPYSEEFMQSVYGRSLYQRIKKEGKQPYLKLKGIKQQPQIQKQPHQIDYIPVKEKKSPSATILNPPLIVQRQTDPPQIDHSSEATVPYQLSRNAILLARPQVRDTRILQPNYIPSTNQPSTLEKKLTQNVLPAVDILPSSSKKVRFGQKTETMRHDQDDDDDEEEDGQGVHLPGYQTDFGPPYDGVKFPPTAQQDQGYQDRKYDHLHTGTVDWLEQELIARFMSQLQSRDPQPPSVKKRHDSLTSSESSDHSLHCRLLDVLGQDGFRLFVDMGQPIDQDLIQALTREVLEERIAQMIGYHTPRESIQLVQQPIPPQRTITPVTTITTTNHHYDDGVSTPQPTPPHSPRVPVQPPIVHTPEITGMNLVYRMRRIFKRISS